MSQQPYEMGHTSLREPIEGSGDKQYELTKI